MADGRRGASPVKIGTLFSRTGVTADVEITELRGTLLAIEEINQAGGILGREVQTVGYDPCSDPKTFKRLAETLMDQDGIRTIVGCYMSSTRKAVIPIVESRRGMLLYPILYEGFEYSPNCICTGAVPNQNTIPFARHLQEQFGSRFYLVGSNYVYAYEQNRVMTDFVRACRGKILDERYLNLNASRAEYDVVVADIVKRQPDVIFSTVVGSGTTHLYQAYRAAGLDPARMPIASLTTGENEVVAMGTEAAEGHITTATFFEVMDRPLAQRFVTAYKAMHGEDAPVPATAEAAYFQMHMLARAMNEAGSEDPAVYRPFLLGRDYDAPQGSVRVDPENHHTYVWPRVATIEPSGRFRIVLDAARPVKPDPYFVASSETSSWDTGVTFVRVG